MWLEIRRITKLELDVVHLHELTFKDIEKDLSAADGYYIKSFSYKRCTFFYSENMLIT